MPQARVTDRDGLAGTAVLARADERALLNAIQQRIADIERTGPPPGVFVDLDRLRSE